MEVLIAHASLGENGKITGGKAGDQSKKEVCIRSWYSKPWSCVIRFNEYDIREKVAKCMEMAAENDHIGYNQSQRNTLLEKARKYNYDVSKVMEDCETDCSALVSVACMYAGIPENYLTYNGNCATTRTLKNILKAVGDVRIFSTPSYTSAQDKLIRGDILLKEGAHVAVVVKEEEKPNIYSPPQQALKIGSKGASVKWLQQELNRHGAKLTVDGVFGNRTKIALILFQKDNGLRQDGIAGKETCNMLNNMARCTTS